MNDVILDVRGLSRHFGGVQAVRDATFTAPRGKTTGLIGPNGAGKTTTFDLIAGRTPPQRGTVSFDGEDVTGWAPEEIASVGLGRTFQIPRVFSRMSVWENLLFAAPHQLGERPLSGLLMGRSARSREDEIAGQAGHVIELLQLRPVINQRAGELSGGQRKLIELARVLMLDPKMIILDEPTAGVAPSLTGELAEHLKMLQEQGRSLLVIEHDLGFIMKICDHLVVMHMGEVLIEGRPEEVREDARVLEAYLGGTHA